MYAALCGSHAVIRVIENWGAYDRRYPARTDGGRL